MSEDTLLKELAKMGLNHRVERQKPYLSPAQVKARLAFAKKYQHWGFEEWSRVAFTDEIGAQTGTNDRKVYVWRSPKEEYHKDTVGVTHISGFRKIKFWAAIRYGKKSKGVFLFFVIGLSAILTHGKEERRYFFFLKKPLFI